MSSDYSYKLTKLLFRFLNLDFRSNLTKAPFVFIEQLSAEEVDLLLGNINQHYNSFANTIEQSLNTPIDCTVVKESLMTWLKQCLFHLPNEKTFEFEKAKLNLKESFLQNEISALEEKFEFTNDPNKRNELETEIDRLEQQLYDIQDRIQKIDELYEAQENLPSILSDSIDFLKNPIPFKGIKPPLEKLFTLLEKESVINDLYDENFINSTQKSAFESLKNALLKYATYIGRNTRLITEFLSLTKDNLSGLTYNPSYILELPDIIFEKFGLTKKLIIKSKPKYFQSKLSEYEEKIGEGYKLASILLNYIDKKSVSFYDNQSFSLNDIFLRFFLSDLPNKRNSKHFLEFIVSSMKEKEHFDKSDMLKLFDLARQMGEPFKQFPLLYIVALYGNAALIEAAIDEFKLDFDKSILKGNIHDARKHFQYYINDAKYIPSIKHYKPFIHCVLTLADKGLLEENLSNNILNDKEMRGFHRNFEFGSKIDFIKKTLEKFSSDELIRIRNFVRKKPSPDTEHIEENIIILQCLYHNDDKIRNKYYKLFVDLDSLERKEPFNDSEIGTLIQNNILTDLDTILDKNGLDKADVKILIESFLEKLISNKKEDELRIQKTSEKTALASKAISSPKNDAIPEAPKETTLSKDLSISEEPKDSIPPKTDKKLYSAKIISKSKNFEEINRKAITEIMNRLKTKREIAEKIKKSHLRGPAKNVTSPKNTLGKENKKTVRPNIDFIQKNITEVNKKISGDIKNVKGIPSANMVFIQRNISDIPVNKKRRELPKNSFFTPPKKTRQEESPSTPKIKLPVNRVLFPNVQDSPTDVQIVQIIASETPVKVPFSPCIIEPTPPGENTEQTITPQVQNTTVNIIRTETESESDSENRPPSPFY